MRTRLRRYPALGFLAAAALLASLLPSALRVPLSGPTASAELAPVPGKSDSAQGDLSALGETSTGGLGAGSGTGGLGGGGRGGPGPAPDIDQPPPLDDNGSGRNPANKRCVGRPLRQTEDPLSPACVAFFKGDNFGATSKGVTRDEIRVVVFNGCAADGSFVVNDYDQPQSSGLYRGRAAYVRYFNERFQTYDRRVHLYSVHSSGRSEGPCPEAVVKTAVQRIDEQLDPFYLFPAGFNSRVTPRAAEEAARLGIMAATQLPQRAFSEKLAPSVVSYGPDLEQMASSVVEFLCSRIAGHPARFHGDPSHWQTKRKFGLMYDDPVDPDGRGAQLVLDGLRTRCPAESGEVVIGYVDDADSDSPPASDEAFVRMKLAGVTTLLYSNDLCGFFDFPAADRSGWQGEWFNFGTACESDAFGIYAAGGQASRFFGLMGQRRLGQWAQQHHRQAIASCTDCSADLEVYDQLMLLFTGIQAAGPRLTPANFDRGLRALPARQSRDPFQPSAYFGPTDHFFIKDFALGWWDPAGRAPSSRYVGCWRLVEDGLRYRPEDWAKGPLDDSGIQQRTPEQPCQGAE